MDITEVTAISRDDGGLRRRIGRALARRAGIAHWLIPVAAFLLGVTLSAVGFVGVWRHAASQSDRAQAARVTTDHRLRQTLARVAGLERTVAAERALLVRARTARRTLQGRLAALERTNRTVSTVAGRLPAQIDAVASSATALGRRSASLASALASLQAYVTSNGSSVDPGFLSAQVRYLVEVSRAGEAAAASLKTQLGAVAGTASDLDRAR